MKIQVISNPRCGSTYVGSMFRAGLNLQLFNEPFSGDYTNPERVQEMQHQFPAQIKNINSSDNIVVKNHAYHYQNLQRLGFWDDWQAITFDYTYLLHRRDILETALSLYIAHETNQWAFDYHTKSKITIIPTTLTNIINCCWNNTCDLIDNKYGISVDRVLYYEDLSWNFIDDINNFTEFNVDRTNGHWGNLRNFQPKYNSIENYHEAVKFGYDTVRQLYHPRTKWIGTQFYLRDQHEE